MKILNVIFPLLLISLTSDIFAEINFTEGTKFLSPDSEVFNSPTNKYAVTLTTIGDKEASEQILSILDNGKKISSYKFEGQIANVRWSPLEKYAAINNHAGHYTWCVWIISLKDGSLIRSKNSTTAPDYGYEPDLFSNNGFLKKLSEIYPGYKTDQMRIGYPTIAYKWKNDDVLLLWSRLAFDRLADKKNSVLWAQSAWHVSPHGIRFIDTDSLIKTISLNREETEIPSEINLTIFR